MHVNSTVTPPAQNPINDQRHQAGLGQVEGAQPQRVSAPQTIVIPNPILDRARAQLNRATQERNYAVGIENSWIDAHSHFRPNTADKAGMIGGGGAALGGGALSLAALAAPAAFAPWIAPLFGVVALIGLIAFIVSLLDSKKLDPGAVEPSDMAEQASKARIEYNRASAEYQRELAASTVTVPGTGGDKSPTADASAPSVTGGSHSATGTPSTGASAPSATGGSHSATGTPSTGGSAPKATGGSHSATGASPSSATTRARS